MEIIQSILSVDSIKHPTGSWCDLEGFVIKTDKQEILVGISNDHSCCEHFGSISSEDKFDDFIGAQLLDVKLTDTALNSKVLAVMSELYEPNTMFVDINTSKGSLQFVLYNSHNGYYGIVPY